MRGLSIFSKGDLLNTKEIKRNGREKEQKKRKEKKNEKNMYGNFEMIL